MGHRRCDSDDSLMFSQIKSGELITGHGQHQTRLKTDTTCLPELKHCRSDMKKEWLQRSNRLLQIVNKTSEVIADMRKSKIERGFYKLPMEGKPRKHSHADRIDREEQHRDKSLKLVKQPTGNTKLTAEGGNRQPLRLAVREQQERANTQYLLQQGRSEQKLSLCQAKLIASKPEALKHRLLEKLGDLRQQITINADRVKLQTRHTTDNLEKTMLQRTVALSHSKTRADILNVKPSPYLQKLRLNIKQESPFGQCQLSPWQMQESPARQGTSAARFEL